MKKLLIMAVVVGFAFCSNTMAVTAATVEYFSGLGGGIKDLNGVDFVPDGSLVQLLAAADDSLLDETSVGTGLFFPPFSGEWTKVVSVPLGTGDGIYVKAFNAATEATATHFGLGQVQLIKPASDPPSPADTQYQFAGLVTDIPVPEPSIIPGVLALLLLRKRS